MSNEFNISTLRDAVRFFIGEKLEGRGRVVNTFQGNKGPIASKIVDTRPGKENRVYYLAYNRNFLRRFGQMFPDASEGTDTDSIGQTIHRRVLFAAAEEAMRYQNLKVYAMIVMPDQSVYTIEALTWFQYLQTYRTERVIQGESEKSVSIPIRFMHQFEENENNNIKPTTLGLNDWM